MGADVAVLRWTSAFSKDKRRSWARIFNRVLLTARRKGMTVVVGAGDFKWDLDHDDPDYKNLFCDLDNVICVSATGPLTKWNHEFFHVDFPAWYSNYGLEAIDVAAPGGNRGKARGVLAACSRSRHGRYVPCRGKRAPYAHWRGTA